MFERYTEKARRTIFFARYEASQFGSSYIEAEHLLLGLLREDKALAGQFLPSHMQVEAIRNAIEQRGRSGAVIPTSVDLPLNHEAKRVLAYGAEECERLNQKYIGTQHLLLGLLREEESFAAELLRKQGLTLRAVRERVVQMEAPKAPVQSETRRATLPGLDRWLTEKRAQGGFWATRSKRVGGRAAQLALFAGEPPERKEGDPAMALEERLADLEKTIESIVRRMENAIATHEFDKARVYSDEERKAREELRRLWEQLHLEDPAMVPFLCIEVIGDEIFSEVRKHSEDYLEAGVAQVWLLEPAFQRAYTVSKGEGLREARGEALRIEEPPLEMDLKKIFA